MERALRAFQGIALLNFTSSVIKCSSGYQEVNCCDETVTFEANLCHGYDGIGTYDNCKCKFDCTKPIAYEINYEIMQTIISQAQ